MLDSSQLRTFSVSKIILGSIFLLFCILFPKSYPYILLGIFLSGIAHMLGAWISMWKAKKLNWKYITWMIFLMFFVGFVGFKLDPKLFIFIGNMLFAFHFLYDEFDLQEELRSSSNLIAVINPTILIVISLCKDFFSLHWFTFNYLIIFALFISIIEYIFFIKKVNLFFIHTKILAFFVLLALFLGHNSIYIMSVFLLYHYIFWFIYPVYKLHLYKRDERDGLIMILLLITAAYFYSVITAEPSTLNVLKPITITFYGTIIHILSTAPFGYLFGLPRPKYT